jgi:hypothetical protein
MRIFIDDPIKRFDDKLETELDFNTRIRFEGDTADLLAIVKGINLNSVCWEIAGKIAGEICVCDDYRSNLGEKKESVENRWFEFIYDKLT